MRPLFYTGDALDMQKQKRGREFFLICCKAAAGEFFAMAEKKVITEEKGKIRVETEEKERKKRK